MVSAVNTLDILRNYSAFLFKDISALLYKFIFEQKMFFGWTTISSLE